MYVDGSVRVLYRRTSRTSSDTCTDLFWHSLGTLNGDSVLQAPPTPKRLIKFHMMSACNVMVICTWSACRREWKGSIELKRKTSWVGGAWGGGGGGGGVLFNTKAGVLTLLYVLMTHNNMFPWLPLTLVVPCCYCPQTFSHRLC